MIRDGQRYIVSTSEWFIGPDGESYKAAWGSCHIDKTEDVLGFNPSRPSTNWFMTVGNEEKQIIIAGCQIHYVIRCENRPKTIRDGKTYINKDTQMEYIQSSIYYAE